MFTNEDLNQLVEANQKRAALHQHVLERVAVWADINGDKKVPVKANDIHVEFPEDRILNPEITEVWVRITRPDRFRMEEWNSRLFTVPKGFLFDEDGTYEQKYRQYKALEAELGLTPAKK